MGLRTFFRPASWMMLMGLLFLAASDGFAKGNIPVAPVPSWVQPISLEINTRVRPAEVSYGYHTLLRDYQYHLPGKTVFAHLGYKVFSEEGVQPASEIGVDFDPNYAKLVFHTVRIWRNGKAIDKTKAHYKVIQREKDLEKHIYNEQQSAIIILDDVRIDDVVEYAYSIQGRNPVFGDKFFTSFYLENYDPIDALFIKIVTTPQRPLFIKHDNTNRKPAVATAKGLRTYTWHLKDIAGRAMDSDVPAWYDPFACVYVSEFKSWAELAGWAIPLYESHAPLSRELQEEINSIKTRYGSLDDRIVAATRFVQDKIRYLGFENGISGFKPFPPSKVFQQRFGDCKDKSLLLVTMLRELGVVANPALVNTTYQDQVQTWLPSVYAFNHCIVQAELKGKKIWIDPTISLQRGKYDSIATPDYKAALVIKKGTTGFSHMQVPRHSRTRTTEKFIFADIGGPVTLDVKTEYFGLEADRQRSRFAGMTTRQVEKDYLNYYAKFYPDIALDRGLVFEDDPERNTFTTFEKYKIKGLWTPDEDDKQVLRAEFYPQLIRERLLMPDTRIRKMPIGLLHPLEVEQTIQLFMPEEWSAEAATKTIVDKAFRYRRVLTYQPESHCITYTYSYKNLQDFVPVAGTSAYMKHQKAILDDLGFDLTHNTTAAANVQNFSLNWWMVLAAAAALALAGFGAYRLYGYNPAHLRHAPQGYQIGGWLVLVAFGICISPVRLLIQILDASYFDGNIFSALINPAAMSYNPALAIILVTELILNVSFLVFGLLILVLFFNRRTSLPRLISIYLFSNLAFILIDSVAGGVVNGETTTEMFTPVISSLVGCLIWIPYFNVSVRVKETFVNRLPEPQEQQQVPDLLETVAAEE